MKIFLGIFAGIVLAVIVLAVSCTAIVGSAVNDASKPIKLRYEVTGNADSAMLSYSATNNGVSSETTAKLPWTKEVNFEGPLTGGSVTASNGVGETGKLTCKITNVDTGAVITENSVPGGEFASVSCYGR